MPAAVYQQQWTQRAAVEAARGEPLSAAAKTEARDDEGFSFGDLLDIINPLQHIPIVSTIYRKLTGDTIKPLERLAGDTLYGGVWGAVSSIANLVFESATGKDFGDTAYALLTGDDEKPAAIAAATPRPDFATAPPRRLSVLASTGQTSGLASGEEAGPFLISTLEEKNVPSDLSFRALAAYRHAVLLSDPDPRDRHSIF